MNLSGFQEDCPNFYSLLLTFFSSLGFLYIGHDVLEFGFGLLLQFGFDFYGSVLISMVLF